MADPTPFMFHAFPIEGPYFGWLIESSIFMPGFDIGSIVCELGLVGPREGFGNRVKVRLQKDSLESNSHFDGFIKDVPRGVWRVVR